MAKELVVCLPTEGFGGHERMVVRIVAALTGHGTRVTVICRSLPLLLEELRSISGVEVRLGYGDAGAFEGGSVATFRALLAFRRGIPVLFAPGRMLVHRRHIIAAGLLGRRVIAYVPTCQDSGPFWQRPHRWMADRLAAGFVSHWFTITGHLAAALRRHRHIHTPVDVIPNIASGARAVPKAVAGTDCRLRVLFLGRYDTHAKGLDWLTSALRVTRAQWVGRVHFAFHGEGAGRSLLEALARDCGSGNVVVNGWSDSYAALAHADLMLLPSRVEGFPLVFIEAAKAGVPVLASRFDGAAELLGEGAWLTIGDSDGLLDALRRLSDGAVRQQIANVQRARVLEHADEGKFAAAVAALQARL